MKQSDNPPEHNVSEVQSELKLNSVGTLIGSYPKMILHGLQLPERAAIVYRVHMSDSNKPKSERKEFNLPPPPLPPSPPPWVI